MRNPPLSLKSIKGLSEVGSPALRRKSKSKLDVIRGSSDNTENTLRDQVSLLKVNIRILIDLELEIS
jgi:hypothetical protein